MLDIVSDDIVERIFFFFSANTLNNAILVNKNLKCISDNNFIWERVYNNTIPAKFISDEKKLNMDFKLLLNNHLAALKRTEWFKRQLFMLFIYEHMEVNYSSTTTTRDITTAFVTYSKNIFSTIPTSIYMEPLCTTEHQHKKRKYELLSSITHCINVSNSYLHWSFPHDKNERIMNVEIV